MRSARLSPGRAYRIRRAGISTTFTAGATNDRNGPSSHKTRITTGTPLAASAFERRIISRREPPPSKIGITTAMWRRSLREATSAARLGLKLESS